MNREAEIKALLKKEGFSVNDSGNIAYKSDNGINHGSFFNISSAIKKIIEEKFSIMITVDILIRIDSQKSDLENLSNIISLAKKEIKFPELGEPLFSTE